MILKASQRGGGMQLGRHLLKDENEHVEVHEVRGFMAETVMGAMKEAQAVAQGTRCKQFLFSVSLNPPESAKVGVDVFEAAIERIEAQTGLTGQPRIVVFHEKQSRRHAHCVWSRIDADQMKAVPLPFFKMKLREVSKGLYLEHGWQMPRGLMDSKARDPKNFDLAEWQQAKRMGRDPAALKATIQECWTVSDSKAGFAQALEERGLHLARGDRRAHVAVTYEGEVLSIARTIGMRTKEVAAKLGNADDLRGVDETKAHIASAIRPRLEALIADADRQKTQAMKPLEERQLALRQSQRVDRHRLDQRQARQREAETRERSSRLRTGVMGLWDRLTGRHGRTVQQNEAEALASLRRDRTARDALVGTQLDERRELQRGIKAVRHQHLASILELHRDLARQGGSPKPEQNETLSAAFGRAAKGQSASTPIVRARGGERGASRRGERSFDRGL